MRIRQGEIQQPWFRSNRFYNLQDSWYFTTREGVDHGPFDSQQEASKAMQDYLDQASASASPA